MTTGYDHVEAQRRNPCPAGTIFDTPEAKRARLERKHPIARRSASKNRAKKRAQHLTNKQARAALYTEYQGERGWNNTGRWHPTLAALSKGTL